MAIFSEGLSQIIIHDGVPPIAALPNGILATNASEVGPAKLAIFEVGEVQPCLAEVGSTEIRVVKCGFHQVRFHHGRTAKVTGREVAFGKVRSVKDGPSEVGTAVASLAENGFGVVLERVIDHHGFVSRRFVVSRVALSTARHDHAYTSALERLSRCAWPSGVRIANRFFVVFSVGDHQEISFLQSVEVQGKVARWVNACIGEQFVHHGVGCLSIPSTSRR